MANLRVQGPKRANPKAPDFHEHASKATFEGENSGQPFQGRPLDQTADGEVVEAMPADSQSSPQVHRPCRLESSNFLVSPSKANKEK